MNYRHTPEYFQIPTNYFWQWADKSSVIEWKNGDTICYTDDLLQILRSLSDSGVPSLGATLLVMAACNDSWKRDADCTGILHGLIKAIPQTAGDSDDDVLAYHINRAVVFMDIISQLPADVRKGYRRSHLLHEITGGESIVIKGVEVINAIDDLAYVQKQLNLWYAITKEIARSQFIADLRCLTTALEKYPTAQKLETQLRTGLTAIPLPAPIELPEQKPADLLQELLEEPKTTGISRLAKKIIASLNIPMHLQRSGGQSYGGISDITNRGNFDRLLLSELANDDTMLMTRLVNNEALYLRREEPPHNPKTKRVLLIDSTLKLWGVSRVFAVSAALACTQNTRHGEAIEAYILGGHHFTEADLTTKPGVIQSLQQLDPALHCTAAVADCLNNVSDDSQIDSILITSEETIHEGAFQKWLAASGDVLGFIITVNRNGSLHFNSLVNGHLKQLTAAKFDLEELLFTPVHQKHLPVKISGRPAFSYKYPEPLLFPAAGVRLHANNSFYLREFDSKGLITITENQRLLYWESKDKGAKELLTFIETGMYNFGSDDYNVYILVGGLKDKLILYSLEILNEKLQRFEIQIDEMVPHYFYFQKGLFYIIISLAWDTSKAVAVIDCKSGTLTHYLKRSDSPIEIRYQERQTNARIYNNISGASFKKIVNNGYTIHIRIKSIFIDSDRHLCADFNHFSRPTDKEKFINFKSGTGSVMKEATRVKELHELEENPKLWLMPFLWPDGSTATVDSRGLLHLKSSDTSLPEVTLILIQGKTTACWASDDTVCGSEYFRESILKMMPADFFYTKYITPIIQRILQA